jgi:hypothetical protein
MIRSRTSVCSVWWFFKLGKASRAELVGTGAWYIWSDEVDSDIDDGRVEDGVDGYEVSSNVSLCFGRFIHDTTRQWHTHASTPSAHGQALLTNTHTQAAMRRQNGMLSLPNARRQVFRGPAEPQSLVL